TPAGLNIYPEDLEAALRRQPAIRDAVVIPLQIGANAEPCAILLCGTVTPDGASGESEVRAAIDAADSSLADYQRIRRWLVWPDLDFPRTPTGKPRLAVISSRAAELLGAPASSASESFTS